MGGTVSKKREGDGQKDGRMKKPRDTKNSKWGRKGVVRGGQREEGVGERQTDRKKPHTVPLGRPLSGPM